MGDSKIQFKIGSVEFLSEGEEAFVSAQLDKILKQIPELIKVAPPKPEIPTHTPSDSGSKAVVAKLGTGTNLAGFLREKVSTPNTVKTFLATAAFLQIGGKDKLVTADITRALSDAKQSKLYNASQNLNDNVKKGHCEKNGDSFFVTTSGLAQLGITE